MSRFIVILSLLFFALPAMAAPVLNSAVLPNARVVGLTDTATIFMTTLNSGDMDATNCTVVPSVRIGAGSITGIDVAWALTDGAGGLVGNVNDPFLIAANGSAQLVLGINRNATAASFDLNFRPIFHVECDGGFGSLGTPAVNEASIRFSDTDPDIIPIIQTFSADGIANFDGSNRLAVVSVAATNISALDGIEADVGVTGQYLGFRDAGQFNFFACETDAAGACLTALITCAPNPGFGSPCFTTKLGKTPKTYSFFVILPENEGIPFFPGRYRFSVGFRNQFGSLISSTSVALNSAIPVTVPAGPPRGQFEFLVQNTNDLGARTLRGGRLTISDQMLSGRIYRFIDFGRFIGVFEAFFRSASDFTLSATETPTGKDISKAASMDPAWTSRFGVTFLDDDIDVADNSVTVTQALLEISGNLRGGIIAWSDALGEQIPGEPDVFDALEATQFELFRTNELELERISVNNAADWKVSSGRSPGGFGQIYSIIPIPGAGGGLKGSAFTLKDGSDPEKNRCTYNVVDIFFSGAAPDQKLSSIGITPISCPSGDDMEPFIGNTVSGNVEVSNGPEDTKEVQMTFTFGDLINNAILIDIFMQYTPSIGPPPEQPQISGPLVQEKTEMQQWAQELANTAGKPVYWMKNQQKILLAKPAQ
ncbi:hypothetical protein MNBD_ALPHA06-948 [hydrothermal vent metagenome]|uniref:Uncharacterized protein n=1 Tax=hydrothermal vent metagenome TaxID=652676 RepID=A0A3B0R0V4_9ZZZZ